jgi:NADH-quinone oxidoreductase subunit J
MLELVDIIFISLAVIIVISAILALEARELIYGAVSLAVAFIAVAGIFLLLDAIYVALFQVAIYIGAVVVLILFTIMIVRPETGGQPTDERASLAERAAETGAATIIALVAMGVFFTTGAAAFTIAGPYDITLIDIGRSLFTQYGLAFITMGLVVASSLIGALALAQRPEETDDDTTD